MKIYTKTGDKGSTSLLGGRRISKDDLRIEAYGTLDELNSHLGLLCSLKIPPELVTQFHQIQSYLFVLGAQLASDPQKTDVKKPPLVPAQTLFLETQIDFMESHLKSLQFFILPGGNTASATAHICRTICRRAERRIISLQQNESVEPEIIIYVNRLSDYFFVMARYLCHLNNSDEVYWKG